jgi:hypothetical protein
MKSRSLRPTITSKITRAQLERAVAALAEGDRPPFVALAMGSHHATAVEPADRPDPDAQGRAEPVRAEAGAACSVRPPRTRRARVWRSGPEHESKLCIRRWARGRVFATRPPRESRETAAL